MLKKVGLLSAPTEMLGDGPVVNAFGSDTRASVIEQKGVEDDVR